ncbi:MAG: hypothetical protein OFPI_12460 [Osedax symbiont Rs2]|nr:MAG: hypothetical protein OFPI_12460 [Osedax symbiont Rs2]
MQQQYLSQLLLAVVLLPLLSATLLLLVALFSVNLKNLWVATLAVAAIAGSAICVVLIHLQLADTVNFSFSYTYANWLNVGSFSAAFGVYLDGLSLVMISIVSGVGFLIHLYSVGFMAKDQDFQRFFIYLNLFVAAMLVLVLADNLLMLFLGWEGVGLCSYLLIGFWHQKHANSLAANKAFIMTRIGDTAMAIALLLLFIQLGTLDIQLLQQQAVQLWPLQNSQGAVLDSVTVCALLLLAGAVGKSGQLPLQSWLPDAMAGPTPVSALIHAATMVTAGVYLVARFHQLFSLSPLAMQAVATIGAITLIIAATAALVQRDVKRILAYSTISQIGYMFLALGAGAYSAAVFHLMTHAFFKALLFLAAGALIYCMQHQHNIFRMGGLRSKLPLICICFFFGCAALAALPLMSGFFSKELILQKLLDKEMYGFWLVALSGAFITAFYSFRLFFVVFFGSTLQLPDAKPATSMKIALSVLVLLSIFGGIKPSGLAAVFSESELASDHNLAIVLLTIAVPLSAIAVCWFVFKKQLFNRNIKSDKLRGLHNFLYSGWGFDQLYNSLFVRPFIKATDSNKKDFIDSFYTGLSKLSQLSHHYLSTVQNGQLRWYSASLVLFSIAAMTYLLTS